VSVGVLIFLLEDILDDGALPERLVLSNALHSIKLSARYPHSAVELISGWMRVMSRPDEGRERRGVEYFFFLVRCNEEDGFGRFI